MKTDISLFGSLIAVFLTAGGLGYLVGIFNSLIQVKNNIGKAWGNIDVLLLQRNEEIPKLLDVSKSYMAHEKDLFTNLVMLRAGYEKAKGIPEKIGIENKMERVFKEFFLIGEQYPDLRANQLFQNITQRVSDLEGSIADRRVFCNDSVGIYNTQIEKFPHKIFAWIFDFKPHPYLDIPEKK